MRRDILEYLVVNTKADMEQAVVLRILADIEQHTRVNLSDVAEKYGIEITALSRMIKRFTRCSFMELLHTARFNRAVVLLRNTDMSVVNIAAAIGYENTAFFYRRFAEKYGCTPNEYRKKFSSDLQK